MMKKLLVINILLVICFVFAGRCYASGWVEHEAAWVIANEIPIGYGGFGGKFPIAAMHFLHSEIDGYGGGLHRHNGTHNPGTVYKKSLVVSTYNIPRQVVINSVIIHNILDMADLGPDGTNGYEATAQRRLQAQKLKQKIFSKVGFKNSPTWTRIAGKEIAIKTGKMSYKIKKFCVTSYRNCANFYGGDAIKKVLSKVSVVVETVPPSVWVDLWLLASHVNQCC